MQYSLNLMNNPEHRRVLLVLTDAKETGQTQVNPSAVIEAAKTAGVLVYGIRYDTGPEEGYYFETLPIFSAMDAYADATTLESVQQAIQTIVMNTVVGCSNSEGTNGDCGSAAGVTVTSAPTSDLCAAGTPGAVIGAGPWSWSCNGADGGTSAWCSAPPPVVDGTCGSVNGQTVTTKPTTGLCDTGEAILMSGNGPWSWWCDGSGGGQAERCTAYPPCQGREHADRCWYLGGAGRSCDSICNSHGGNDNGGTIGYVGSGGTLQQCRAVAAALLTGLGNSSSTDDSTPQSSAGCVIEGYWKQQSGGGGGGSQIVAGPASGASAVRRLGFPTSTGTQPNSLGARVCSCRR
jgi:hypothetical protein